MSAGPERADGRHTPAVEPEGCAPSGCAPSGCGCAGPVLYALGFFGSAVAAAALDGSALPLGVFFLVAAAAQAAVGTAFGPGSLGTFRRDDAPGLFWAAVGFQALIGLVCVAFPDAA